MNTLLLIAFLAVWLPAVTYQAWFLMELAKLINKE